MRTVAILGVVGSGLWGTCLNQENFATKFLGYREAPLLGKGRDFIGLNLYDRIIGPAAGNKIQKLLAVWGARSGLALFLIA